jgi:hypothetical protein
MIIRCVEEQNVIGMLMSSIGRARENPNKVIEGKRERKYEYFVFL